MPRRRLGDNETESSLHRNRQHPFVRHRAFFHLGLNTTTQRHLGRLVREGKIPNAGRLGAPRIACGDLPRKPDVAADIETGHISSKQIVRSAINEGAG